MLLEVAPHPRAQRLPAETTRQILSQWRFVAHCRPEHAPRTRPRTHCRNGWDPAIIWSKWSRRFRFTESAAPSSFLFSPRIVEVHATQDLGDHPNRRMGKSAGFDTAGVQPLEREGIRSKLWLQESPPAALGGPFSAFLEFSPCTLAAPQTTHWPWLERSTSQRVWIAFERHAGSRRLDKADEILAREGEIPMTRKNIHLCSNLCCQDLKWVIPCNPDLHRGPAQGHNENDERVHLLPLPTTIQVVAVDWIFSFRIKCVGLEPIFGSYDVTENRAVLNILEGQ